MKALLLLLALAVSIQAEDARPNILFCIADDASYAHFSANGDPVVKTPNFDRVAREGVRFTHSFCSSPSCTPSRSAVLTGRPFFQLEESGNLWSTLRKEKFAVYPDLLEQAGYAIGLTRKGWGPGDFKPGGFSRNPAGLPFKGFGEFRKTVREGQPWCFWFGSTDPHRPYEAGSGASSGKDLAKIRVPGFLPDEEIVRSDIADYLTEIERFDREIGEIIAQLEAAGELDRTLIVITSDNGMPFPRSKANLYDSGTRMPLAIRWPARVPGGRTVEDFVSHTDFAPTFLEAAGLSVPPEMRGRSLLPLLISGKSGRIENERERVFFGRERHANVRAGSVGYPSRAIRTRKWLYIRNFEPDRWPAGDPESPPESEIERTFGDIDAGPTKAFMMENRASARVATPWRLAAEKRPVEELYDIATDPDQLVNVADRADLRKTREELRLELQTWLTTMKDPRARAESVKFDEYPYFGGTKK